MSARSAVDAAQRRRRWIRQTGWLLLWAVLVVVSVQFLLAVHGKYKQVDPDAYTMFWSRRGWLWTHLAGGTLTIVLGPLQFLTRWPRAYPRLHRWAGRLYLTGILIGSTGAIGLIATSPAPLSIRGAFAATMLAWLVTSVIALIAIRRGSIRIHRRWMRRNYLVTLSPVTFRLLLPASIAMGLMPSPDLIAILLWASWLLPLLIDAVCTRLIPQIRGSTAQPAPAHAAHPS